jgi:hypothetical protein
MRKLSLNLLDYDRLRETELRRAEFHWIESAIVFTLPCGAERDNQIRNDQKRQEEKT